VFLTVTNLTIANGNEQTEIYVKPGADLTLTVDGNNFDSTIHFEGMGMEIANFMAKCVLEKHASTNFENLSYELCNKPPDEFVDSLQKLLKTELGYIGEKRKNVTSII
jgi:hypothetical protein